MRDALLKIWKIGRWVLAVVAVLYVGLVIYRIPAVIEKEKTAEAVERIQSQKLTVADVTGERLPPEPDSVAANATIEGVDANQNGIRDDVELAIFERYPGDVNIKIRAAMLQYAKAQQLFLTTVFNSDTWVVATQQGGRGFGCIYNNVNNDNIALVLDRTHEVEDLVRDTTQRKEKYQDLDKFRSSFSVSDRADCDLTDAQLEK